MEVVAPAADRSGDRLNHAPDPASTTSSPLRPALAVLLALALVGAVVWLVLAVADREDGASSQQSSRDAVMLRTREYVEAAWNYGEKDLDDKGKLTDYRDRVGPLITTSFKTEFDKSVTVLDQLVAQEGFARTTTVEHVGVETLDEDSAQVIVSGLITESQKGKALDPTPYFWEIDLEKIEGAWKVSDLGGFQGDEK